MRCLAWEQGPQRARKTPYFVRGGRGGARRTAFFPRRDTEGHGELLFDPRRTGILGFADFGMRCLAWEQGPQRARKTPYSVRGGRGGARRMNGSFGRQFLVLGELQEDWCSWRFGSGCKSACSAPSAHAAPATYRRAPEERVKRREERREKIARFLFLSSLLSLPVSTQLVALQFRIETLDAAVLPRRPGSKQSVLATTRPSRSRTAGLYSSMAVSSRTPVPSWSPRVRRRGKVQGKGGEWGRGSAGEGQGERQGKGNGRGGEFETTAAVAGEGRCDGHSLTYRGMRPRRGRIPYLSSNLRQTEVRSVSALVGIRRRGLECRPRAFVYGVDSTHAVEVQLVVLKTGVDI